MNQVFNSPLFDLLDLAEEDSYLKLENKIKQLEAKYPLVDRSEYKNYVNFSMNSNEPFHNWFYYKEGYSSELIEMLLKRFRYQEGDKLLDPFCGSGTTLISGKKLGLEVSGFDVNPISSFITSAKLQDFHPEDIHQLKEIMNNFRLDESLITKNIPQLSILDKIFSKENLHNILILKGFIERFEDQKIYFPLKVAYLSIIESVSNMKKDGNGIKYLKVPKPRPVREQFLIKLQSIISDLEIYSDYFTHQVCFNVVNDSFLNQANHHYFQENKVDHIIFSPPYANCFDYCAVYKMELWMGGFVTNYSDFRRLRQLAIRSHVNGSVNPSMEYEYDLINWISSELETFKLWDKKIPRMIRGYFDDMTKTLINCYNLLNDNGHCAIVVGNSAYKGYVVPTDLMLAYIGEKIGFKVVEIGVARTLNTSSQQMNQQDYLKNHIRESIIILKKKGKV